MCQAIAKENRAVDPNYFNDAACKSMCNFPWTLPDNCTDSGLRHKGLVVTRTWQPHPSLCAEGWSRPNGSLVGIMWTKGFYCMLVNMTMSWANKKDCILSKITVMNTTSGLGGYENTSEYLIHNRTLFYHHTGQVAAILLNLRICMFFHINSKLNWSRFICPLSS